MGCGTCRKCLLQAPVEPRGLLSFRPPPPGFGNLHPRPAAGGTVPGPRRRVSWPALAQYPGNSTTVIPSTPELPPFRFTRRSAARGSLAPPPVPSDALRQPSVRSRCVTPSLRDGQLRLLSRCPASVPHPVESSAARSGLQHATRVPHRPSADVCMPIARMPPRFVRFADKPHADLPGSDTARFVSRRRVDQVHPPADGRLGSHMARSCGWGVLQTPPHDDVLALSSPSALRILAWDLHSTPQESCLVLYDKSRDAAEFVSRKPRLVTSATAPARTWPRTAHVAHGCAAVPHGWN